MSPDNRRAQIEQGCDEYADALEAARIALRKILLYAGEDTSVAGKTARQLKLLLIGTNKQWVDEGFLCPDVIRAALSSFDEEIAL